MPTYEYYCSNCAKKLEIFQKITDEPLKQCPECGKQSLSRGPGGGIGLQFKGSGFYITDYGPRKKDSEPGSSCKSKPEGGCCPCGKTS